MEIAITLTDKELHDLSNQVQVALWKAEMGNTAPSTWVTVGERIIAAANETRPEGKPGSALEYAGRYFQTKAKAEHLEVQNTLLMTAVQQMAQRGSVMQAALIEAGLADKIPPPARLLNVASNGPA